MRSIARLTIAAVVLGLGGRYALDGRWWVVFICGLVGAQWIVAPGIRVERWRTLGLLFFGGIGGAGVYLGYSPVWLLTNMILLLMAWDLDHFSRVLDRYDPEPVRADEGGELIRIHLTRLGVVAASSWALGLLTIWLRVSTPFIIALSLSILVFFVLLRGIRYFGQDEDRKQG